MKLLHIICLDFDVTDQILIRYQISYNRQILEKKWEYNGTVHPLFTDLEKAYDLVRRKVLYNILTEYCIFMKVVRIIKMCLNET